MAVWNDRYDGDYGAYAVFAGRGECLDWLADTVMERAATLGVPVLSNEDWRTEIGRDEVRDWLGSEHEFDLVLSWSLGYPDETVSVGIRECERR